MSILFNIEGPKGSGKSTLIKRMIDRKIATRSRGFSGDWNNLMTDDHSRSWIFEPFCLRILDVS